VVRSSLPASALPVLFLFVLRMLQRPPRPAAARAPGAVGAGARASQGAPLRAAPHPPARHEAVGARAT
jgi:hypothetical protein